MYAKDTFEPKYQLLMKNREDVRIKYYNNAKAFMEYSNAMDDIYNDINDYNPNRIHKILIAFDDMIANENTNKNISP